MPYDLSACGLVTVSTSRFVACALGSHIFGNPNVSDDGTVIIGTVVNGTALSLTDGNAAHTYFKFNVACGSVIQSDSRLTFITTGACNALVLTGGCAGIGTSSPSGYGHGGSNRILEIFNCNTSANAQSHIILSSGATSNPGSFGTITWAGPNYSTANRAGIISVSTETGATTIPQSIMQFYTSDATSGILERMRITSTGNVGIGTAAPTSKLDICGADGKIQSRVDSSDGSTINVRPNAGKCGWISYTEDAVADRWGIGVKNGDAKLYFSSGNVSSGGGTTRMIIDGGGCVGINTTSPTYRLHVNGTFYAAGSSQDYKQSICNYNTDSCMFMKLKPVTYQYKEEYCHLGKELKSGTQIGLIAEEVAESHPELAILVNEENEKVVRNVDYEKLTIILLSELQKLRQEVDQLKNK